MNLLRTLFSPDTHGDDKVARREPRLLLVGADFAWIPNGASLANRRATRVDTREEALNALAAEPFDGIIAGLPEMGKNLALLSAAATAHPTLACGLRLDAAKVGKVAVSHPIITPTDSLPVMDDQVRTMFATAYWSADPAFAALKAHISVYPALPSLYLQISEALKSEDTTLETLAALITREPTVSAKLLQVVNSPVFSRGQRVTSIRDAASVLGFQRVRALVLATSLFGQCDASKCASFSAENFESHSLQIATWAAQIAKGETGDGDLAEMAFTAGLLHQFGVLLLAANLPDGYDHVLRIAGEQKISIARVEAQTYGVTHAELAGYIFASWSIPFPILNAVGYYARPSQSEDQVFTPLTAVHMATVIDSFGVIGVRDFDAEYLGRLHMHPQIDYWSRKLIEKPWA